MLFETIIDELKTHFSEDIYKSNIVHANEVYMEVNAERILKVCKYIGEQIHGILVSLFAGDERKTGGQFAVYYIFGLRDEHVFIILKTVISEDRMAFHSITNDIHAAHLYEREIHDLYGLVPEGHPDLRRLVFHGNWPDQVYPLRKDYDGRKKPPFVKGRQEFIHIDGEGVYEIPVGPVHAGIIEPGHFRFSVAGEPIIHLEAQLYFVHKGIEKICEDTSIEKCFYISERISGDETFSNSLAYCQAIEKIAGVQVPERASFSRVVFAELERLISHFGDLGGICTDVAYGFAAYQFQMLRGWMYQLADEVCHSRFLRSVNKLGGIRMDFIEGKEKLIMEFMNRTFRELTDTVNMMKSNSLFIDRVENTGVLQNNTAVDMNTVGPAGRAAGITCDARKDFPYAAYDQLKFSVPHHNNGDVNCRMNVKIEECFESINIILQAVEMMKKGEILTPVTSVESFKVGVGCTESPRGENIHWIMTGENNTIFRYKIRTPSFCNWPALCYAVKGNIVPDFPLINKSFNLSYAGNDL